MDWGAGQAIPSYMVYWLLPRHPELFNFEVLRLHNDDSPMYTVNLMAILVELDGSDLAVYNQRGVRPPVLHH